MDWSALSRSLSLLHKVCLATAGNIDAFRTVADANETIDAFTGDAPLHLAASNGRTRLVLYPVSRKDIRVNKANLAGNTAAHLAALQRYDGIVIWLLRAGADLVDAENNRSESVRDIVARNQRGKHESHDNDDDDDDDDDDDGGVDLLAYIDKHHSSQLDKKSLAKSFGDEADEEEEAEAEAKQKQLSPHVRYSLRSFLDDSGRWPMTAAANTNTTTTTTTTAAPAGKSNNVNKGNSDVVESMVQTLTSRYRGVATGTRIAAAAAANDIQANQHSCATNKNCLVFTLALHKALQELIVLQQLDPHMVNPEGKVAAHPSTFYSVFPLTFRLFGLFG